MAILMKATCFFHRAFWPWHLNTQWQTIICILIDKNKEESDKNKASLKELVSYNAVGTSPPLET